MNEDAIRSVGFKLGLRGGYRSRDWVQYHCYFAPWTHEKGGTDTKASFGIKIKQGIGSHFWCFTCKRAGSLPQLPIEMSRFDHIDRSALMMEIIQMEVSEGFGVFDAPGGTEEDLEPLDEQAYGDLYDPAYENPLAREYLRTRNVSERASQLLGLGWEETEQRIVFPVRGFRNELYGFTGRTINADVELRVRDFYGLNKKRLLLGAQLHQPGNRALIVEGLFDMANCVSEGALDYGLTPMAIMGSHMSEQQAALLIDADAPSYLMLDNDAAGENGIYGIEDVEQKKRWDEMKARGYIPNWKPKRTGGARKRLIREVPVFIPLYPEGIHEPDKLIREDFPILLAETRMEQGT